MPVVTPLSIQWTFQTVSATSCEFRTTEGAVQQTRQNVEGSVVAFLTKIPNTTFIRNTRLVLPLLMVSTFLSLSTYLRLLYTLIP